MGGVFGAVELEQVGAVRVMEAGPAELVESLLEFGVGSDHMVGWEVD